ncbi:MAG: hypothetical protein ACM3PT_12235 [Deltaproteobacteria bacterium]
MNEIADKVKKCPYCHSYQKWYFDNAILYRVLIVLIIVSLFVFNRLSKNDYEFKDFEKNFKIEIVNVQLIKKESNSYKILNLKIDNQTAYKWKNPVVEVSYFNPDGVLAFTEFATVYQAKISKKEKTNCSFDLRPPQDFLNYKFKIKLKDLDPDRF